jgi:hypothetical protein
MPAVNPAQAALRHPLVNRTPYIGGSRDIVNRRVLVDCGDAVVGSLSAAPQERAPIPRRSIAASAARSIPIFTAAGLQRRWLARGLAFHEFLVG